MKNLGTGIRKEKSPQMKRSKNNQITGCLNINGTYVTDNNSTNSNFMFFSVSDLKIVYYNNLILDYITLD